MIQRGEIYWGGCIRFGVPPKWMIILQMTIFTGNIFDRFSRCVKTACFKLPCSDIPHKNPSHSHKATAVLLGFSTGDALGATTEFMTRDEIRSQIGVHTKMTGGGWQELTPGETTDDTAMTLCVARSLVANHGYNIRDMADRFAEWFNSNPPDVGRTCRIGIRRYIDNGVLEAPIDAHGAGNGGVMRSLPLIVLYAGDRESMHEKIISQSRITHNCHESDEGCRCYADVVAAALNGADKNKLSRIVRHQYPIFSPDSFDGRLTGYIVDTLRTVFHFFISTDSFEKCLVGVVNNGGDADTTGALAGGLAGAYYGFHSETMAEKAGS